MAHAANLKKCTDGHDIIYQYFLKRMGFSRCVLGILPPELVGLFGQLTWMWGFVVTRENGWIKAARIFL